MTDKKTCDSCSDASCSSKTQLPGEKLDQFIERQQLMRRLCEIKHKIMVLSGKGGVGKSTVAVNLAVTLAREGKTVGLLDVDIHGPSIPRLLNLEDSRVEGTGEALLPVPFDGNLKVMSIGFLLQGRDAAVIWRGPMKYGVIKQFLKDVEWGKLDYLIVDSPPGTGDEPLSVCQLIQDPAGAVIVTTPQELALLDVRKSITFCRQLNVPVLGVIENMSGFVCPKCGELTNIFDSGGAERMAKEMNVPFLGRIPIDPALVLACDAGTPFAAFHAETETAKAFRRAIRPILDRERGADPARDSAETVVLETRREEDKNMTRIAIPVAQGRLSAHFGHCEEFALIDADLDAKIIRGKEMVAAPEHQPGLLPKWLAERGANVIIAGGMGMRAQSLFTEQNIAVVVGAPAEEPDAIAQKYVAGTLTTGTNICDH
ncbi:MAG: P-loop NTPase [Kiritimatiellae bacterium]|nr:P-loop NTPase [Kiritimatiellia bacterium]